MGTTIGVIKGDTRSLDNGSCRSELSSPSFGSTDLEFIVCFAQGASVALETGRPAFLLPRTLQNGQPAWPSGSVKVPLPSYLTDSKIYITINSGCIRCEGPGIECPKPYKTWPLYPGKSTLSFLMPLTPQP